MHSIERDARQVQGEHMHRSRTGLWCALTAALVMSACASQGGNSDATGSTPATTATTKAAATTSAAPVTTPDSTSVTEPVETTVPAPTGPATGEPVRISYRHIDLAVPEVTDGVEAAVKYLNEKGGGIAGRPIELVKCEINGTPENTIDCANQAVEQGVILSLVGADPSGDAAVPVLTEAGIAETGQATLGPIQPTDVGHSFFFSNPNGMFGQAGALAFSSFAATKVRLFGLEGPATRDFEPKFMDASEKAGLDAKVIYYDAGAADWTALISAAMAEGADGIGVMSAPTNDCVSMISTARQLSFSGLIFAGACSGFAAELDPSLIEGVVTYAELYPADIRDSVTPEVAAQIDLYIEAMTAFGKPERVSTLADNGFSLMMTVADSLNQIAAANDGELTAANVLNGFPKVKGIRFMSAPYNCDGSIWPNSTSCILAFLLLQQQEDGSRKVVDGGFVDASRFSQS
jgi:branched-chain amino acid transport system substrate-binding protein